MQAVRIFKGEKYFYVCDCPDIREAALRVNEIRTRHKKAFYHINWKNRKWVYTIWESKL